LTGFVSHVIDFAKRALRLSKKKIMIMVDKPCHILDSVEYEDGKESRPSHVS
jgi:hypothetical protein